MTRLAHLGREVYRGAVGKLVAELHLRPVLDQHGHHLHSIHM